MSGKRVRAKTGTLDGVSGLTGVITDEGGEPQLAFSILINVVDESSALYASRRRAIEDRIVVAVLAALDEYEARKLYDMQHEGTLPAPARPPTNGSGTIRTAIP